MMVNLLQLSGIQTACCGSTIRLEESPGHLSASLRAWRLGTVIPFDPFDALTNVPILTRGVAPCLTPAQGSWLCPVEHSALVWSARAHTCLQAPWAAGRPGGAWPVPQSSLLPGWVRGTASSLSGNRNRSYPSRLAKATSLPSPPPQLSLPSPTVFALSGHSLVCVCSDGASWA